MDIKALVNKAIGITEGIAEQAYKTITVRLNPDAPAYDPVTETPARTWEAEVSVQALEYDHQEERDGEQVLQKIFMVKVDDLGVAVNDTDTRAEIEVAGIKYQANKVMIDPVAATARFVILK